MQLRSKWAAWGNDERIVSTGQCCTLVHYDSSLCLSVYNICALVSLIIYVDLECGCLLVGWPLSQHWECYNLRSGCIWVVKFSRLHSCPQMVEKASSPKLAQTLGTYNANIKQRKYSAGFLVYRFFHSLSYTRFLRDLLKVNECFGKY